MRRKMNSKESSSNSDKSPPPQGADDEDEKLLRSAESWLLCMCQKGRASWDSDPERVARFLQEFGNEKLGLDIPIDIDEIRSRLLNMDSEMRRQCSSSSSSDDAGRRPPPPSPPLPPPSPPSPPPPPPAPPADGRRLFIRKQLHKTDVEERQARLSMPCSQVDGGVLTAEEAEGLRARVKMAVKVVDGAGRRYDAHLRWARIGAGSCSIYAIGKPWNDIKKDNGFREGMMVEVWGVRGEKGELSFHLIRGDA